jgi:hypothetical protein
MQINVVVYAIDPSILGIKEESWEVFCTFSETDVSLSGFSENKNICRILSIYTFIPNTPYWMVRLLYPAWWIRP